MSIEDVTIFFCQKRDVPLESINSREHNPRYWGTRYMIWYYMHYAMGMSLLKISKKVGRNRPSVCRGIRILKGHMHYHKDVREEYRAIVKELEGMTEATPSENMEE